MLLGSWEHLEEIKRRVNSDEKLMEIAKNVGRISVTCILQAETDKNAPEICVGVLINRGMIEDIWLGVRETEFVVSGKYGIWVRILRDELGISLAITTKKLRFKGNLKKLFRISGITHIAMKVLDIIRSLPVELHGGYAEESTTLEG
ncbi:MAG: hypothetical protein ACFE9L_21905 [Candidatus Hodarchaeota archaeon]